MDWNCLYLWKNLHSDKRMTHTAVFKQCSEYQEIRWNQTSIIAITIDLDKLRYDHDRWTTTVTTHETRTELREGQQTTIRQYICLSAVSHASYGSRILTGKPQQTKLVRCWGRMIGTHIDRHVLSSVHWEHATLIACPPPYILLQSKTRKLLIGSDIYIIQHRIERLEQDAWMICAIRVVPSQALSHRHKKEFMQVSQVIS